MSVLHYCDALARFRPSSFASYRRWAERGGMGRGGGGGGGQARGSSGSGVRAAAREDRRASRVRRLPRPWWLARALPLSSPPARAPRAPPPPPPTWTRPPPPPPPHPRL